MEKDYINLKMFDWNELLTEIVNKAPYFAKFAIAMMLKPEDWLNVEKLEGVKYRICVVYAILMQGRMRELSRVQRIISMLLLDSVCEEKVHNNC
jgi:hypothetical protein